MEGGGRIDALWCNVRRNPNRKTRWRICNMFERWYGGGEAAVTGMWYDG